MFIGILGRQQVSGEVFFETLLRLGMEIMKPRQLYPDLLPASDDRKGTCDMRMCINIYLRELPSFDAATGDILAAVMCE